eukprot:jgi/Tetstr1/443742/TSEL_031730.t1
MKLHGEVYTFKPVLGGDMAFHGDYERKGMTKPITKSTWYAAMMAHAMGKEYGLEEPYLCPGYGLTIRRHQWGLPSRVKIQAVWEKYYGMSGAWAADPGGLTADMLAAANKLRTATEMFFAAFPDIATAKEVTPYMHEVAWHFPRWMELQP